MSEPAYEPVERRPISSREVAVFQRFAAWMVRRGVSPNGISVSSMIFGSAAGAALAFTPLAEGWSLRWLWLAAALGMQLRLLANLFDGMVAIESGRASPVGELYNEAPDRVSDTAIFIGAGYAVGSCWSLGYLAAVAAMFVAYVRALGVTAGASQHFTGPMAKPQRMFVMTSAAVYCGLAPLGWQPVHQATGWSVMAAVLFLVVAGCVVTAASRLLRIAREIRGSKP